MRSSRLATAFNVASAIATLGVQMAVSFFLSSYLVSTLGEVANGFTQLANNFVSYASLVTIAFNSMGSRFISAAYHRGKVDDSVAYYSTLIVCNAILCLVFLPVAIAVLANLRSIVNMGNADPVDVCLLFAFVFANFGANLFVSLFCSAMFVVNKVYIQNAINLVRNVLNAALLVFAFSFFETRVSYVSLVALMLTLLSAPACYAIKRRVVPELKFNAKAFSGKFVRDLTSSGIWNTVNQCGNILTTGLDLLFANWFVGASPMGVLSVAKTLPSAIINLATTLNNNLEPELVIFYAKEGVEGLYRRLMMDIRLSNLIVAAPIGAFCALSPAFYRLWMPTLDARELSVLSILTICAYIPWAGPQVVYNVFTVMNRLKVNSATYLGGAALNLVLVLMALNFTDFGVYAIAGVSAFIAIARNLLIIAPYVSGLLKKPWWTMYREIVVSFLSVGTSIAISLAFGAAVPTDSWGGLLIAIAASCIISWIVVFFVTFPAEQRRRYAALLTAKFGHK